MKTTTKKALPTIATETITYGGVSVVRTVPTSIMSHYMWRGTKARVGNAYEVSTNGGATWATEHPIDLKNRAPKVKAMIDRSLRAA